MSAKSVLVSVVYVREYNMFLKYLAYCLKVALRNLLFIVVACQVYIFQVNCINLLFTNFVFLFNELSFIFSYCLTYGLIVFNVLFCHDSVWCV